MTPTPSISALIAALALLSGCDGEPQSIFIPFEARYGSNPIDCGTDSAWLTLTDLRFFVASVELLKADGSAAPVKLSDNGRWQNEHLALLDFEDGTGGCENGTPDRNSQVLGSVAPDNYKGLRFVLGVPFELNHADPLAATAPLDDSTMHWHWRSGYKFLRVGFKTPDDGHWIHLGSAGCEGSVQNISHCSFPNRVEVFLDDFVLGDTLIVKLDALVAATDLSDQTPSDCASGPAEKNCVNAFAVIGLDHASGERLPAQRLFQVRKP